MVKTNKNPVGEKAVSVPEEEKRIKKITPVHALSPFEEMDRMFERFFPRGWLRPFRWEMPPLGGMAMPFEGKVPRVDVIDRDNDILVRAELPGVEKKDLDVSITDNTVTIKGSTRHEEKKEEGDYFRREISKGSFSRTVALPGEVDTSRPKASFKDGVLELTLDKMEKSKRRSIKIE